MYLVEARWLSRGLARITKEIAINIKNFHFLDSLIRRKSASLSHLRPRSEPKLPVPAAAGGGLRYDDAGHGKVSSSAA